MSNPVYPELEPLKVDYHHESEKSLIEGLAMFLQIYADSDNWRVSRGSPPHNLREGVLLDFHPRNICNGFTFAKEALQKIDKFYQEQVECSAPPAPPAQRHNRRAGDMVNHPDHYNAGKIEVIDFIEDQSMAEGFNLGNAIKYTSRALNKGNAVEDLKKAIWYLTREVARRDGTLVTTTQRNFTNAIQE